jgi:hypothetical protein
MYITLEIHGIIVKIATIFFKIIEYFKNLFDLPGKACSKNGASII